MALIIDPLPDQDPNTPFQVTGSYTATPLLQVAAAKGTPVPVTNGQADVKFKFTHPGLLEGLNTLTITHPTARLKTSVLVNVRRRGKAPSKPENVKIALVDNGSQSA